MVRKNFNLHHKLIFKWVQESRLIIRRRLYSIKELNSLFVKEIDQDNMIASCTFSLALNKLVGEIDNKLILSKKEVATRQFRYWLSNANDNKSFINNIKRNQRNRKTRSNSKIVQAQSESFQHPECYTLDQELQSQSQQSMHQQCNQMQMQSKESQTVQVH